MCIRDSIRRGSFRIKNETLFAWWYIGLVECGSRMTYSQGFGVDNRKVELEGEGYFEVQRNEKLPLDVYKRQECNDKNLWLSHLQDEKLFHEKNEKNILLIFFLYLSDFGDK